MKAEDCWTVPLTRREHSDCHLVGSKRELEWFAERGIDITALAMELWDASGDLEQMTKIVRKYYDQAHEKIHEPPRCKERED